MVDSRVKCMKILSEVIRLLGGKLPQTTSVLKALLKDKIGDTECNVDFSRELFCLVATFEIKIPHEIKSKRSLTLIEYKRLFHTISTKYPFDTESITWAIQSWCNALRISYPKFATTKPNIKKRPNQKIVDDSIKIRTQTKVHTKTSAPPSPPYVSIKPIVLHQTIVKTSRKIQKTQSSNINSDYILMEKQADEALQKKEFEIALEYYETLIEEYDHHNPYFFHNLALCYYELKYFEQAKINLLKCMKINPEFKTNPKLK